jgi:hypothetical protein
MFDLIRALRIATVVIMAATMRPARPPVRSASISPRPVLSSVLAAAAARCIFAAGIIG